MNPVTALLVDNMVAVYFFYGLAFFLLGVVLLLARRQESELPLLGGLFLLALFGLLHGSHEWVEMFQGIWIQTTGNQVDIWQEAPRVALLVASFLALLAFGVWGVVPARAVGWRYLIVGGLLAAWLTSVVVASSIWATGLLDIAHMADVLSRYLIAIPAAILAAWALMAQQRTFRERNMTRFGRDLVSAATVLIVYGVVGQLFVRKTAVPPSTVINSALFLEWFGFPVQIFRGVTALLILYFMARALRAFQVETHQRLESAARSQIEAQERALEAERLAGRERERLNAELRSRARELSVLLDLSNMLGAPVAGPRQYGAVLQRIVDSLEFADAGMILTVESHGEEVSVAGLTGYATTDPSVEGARYGPSLALGKRSISMGSAVCRHVDGAVIDFDASAVLLGKECWSYLSPTVALALPLMAQRAVIGAIVVARARNDNRTLALDELHLMVGITRQLELSLENARLYDEAQQREKTLERLLHQVVSAQESERQRIARELHDASAQSLSAIALGLRGLANGLSSAASHDETATHAPPPASDLVRQAESLQSFATDALGELRRIISGLRPPQLDDLGLAATLRWMIQSFRERNPAIHFEFTIAGDQVRLPPAYETVIFRVAQEALTNIARHSQAQRASVVLEMKPYEVVLTVQDNGRGFDAAAALTLRGQSSAWGLLGIRERTLLLNGHYEIKSAPGQGTLIRVRIPTQGEAREARSAQGTDDSQPVLSLNLAPVVQPGEAGS